MQGAGYRLRSILSQILPLFFFTAMDEAEIGDEDVNQSSEMSVYASYSWVTSTEITSSDKKEELRIFEEIMKLVLSFKHVVKACSEH